MHTDHILTFFYLKMKEHFLLLVISLPPPPVNHLRLFEKMTVTMPVTCLLRTPVDGFFSGRRGFLESEFQRLINK